ncbi:MAG: hypothetical protein ABR958_02155 [Dehalococcoidales bacterium]
MRQLTSTLLAAQRQETAVPRVKVIAASKIAGAVRYDWTRLYTGTEDDYYHALTMPGDGSLVRARVTPVSDSRKLYRQRVASPGAQSDYSQWTYTGQYSAAVTAAASLGAEVSIFWTNTSREIRRIKSTDYGASWGSPELIDYTPTTAIYGLAAAYKLNGDLAIFFADQATLYVKKNVGGQWQTKAAWDKTTGNLSGAAAIYSGDWYLLVTGKDSAGNFKVWSLVYGDGGEVSAGSWSALQEMASAPSGGAFDYRQPFLDKTDVYRCFFTEIFSGNEAYNRPFWSHTVAGASYLDGLWREPVPFNLSSIYGLAVAHYGDYAWLTAPGGVWRAPLNAQTLDLSADVVSIRQEQGSSNGALTVELKNDDGKYAAPGQGALAVLDIGCQIVFSPGYATSSGDEWSDGASYCLESFEYTGGNGLASLVLHARDGWAALGDWEARHQFRWNKTSESYSVKAIIAIILGRVGLKLEVKSQSAVITGFYPDFTVSPGNDGRTLIGRLLSFVPDRLFIEGNKAYLVNPQSSDSAVYSYGAAHVIRGSHYRQGGMDRNRVQVEGDASGALILADNFNWGEIGRRYDRLSRVADKNLGTVAKAKDRGAAVLREMEIGVVGGEITVPVNCGQQLYDVIDITDAPAGLAAARRRVLGLGLVYQPRRGEYSQRILLGGV